MAAVEGTTHVDAPPERVFAFMDEPENQVAVTPSLASVADVEELPQGRRVTYVYSMAGLSLDGTVETVEYDPPNLLLWTLSGSIEGTIRQAFESEGAGTRVTYAAEYTVPVPVLGTLAAPLVEWYNRREVRRTLANLNAAVESHTEG
jgi:carbon monoxide dehydrogenase subunit G